MVAYALACRLLFNKYNMLSLTTLPGINKIDYVLKYSNWFTIWEPYLEWLLRHLHRRWIHQKGGDLKKMKQATIWAPGIALVTVLMLAAVLGMAHTEADPFVTNLTADQNITVGTVSVWNDANTLYVTYLTTGDWVINESHLAVEEDKADIPQTGNGNPKPGKFAYSNETATADYTYEIPQNLAAGTEVFIAAHAEVVVLNETGAVIQDETAWGEGDQFNVGRNWAMYFNYTIQ